jgi:long-subunit acyl-CoA synthetase (AMP-forming)
MLEDDSTEAPQGTPGELWCKAPQMMTGYWGKPEETRKTITADGWLKTGDIAYVDENGKYVIIDRKKVSRSNMKHLSVMVLT